MAKNPGRGNKGARKNSVPNVVGSAKTTAQTTITNAGFTYIITNENTANSALNETIKSQDIPGGEVRSLGTNINLVNYTFSFTPFGAFGFTPFGAFGFTPFGFTPFTFSPPSCIHENTLIDTPNGKIPAKDINIGDKISTVRIQEIPENNSDGAGDFDYVGFISESLTSLEKTETNVVDIVASQKNTIVYFNGNSEKLFSTSQPFFIKRNNFYEIIPSGAIEVGDSLIYVENDGALILEEVLSIDYITEESTVYQFGCEPQDWFIAGDYLVHNK
jgi:hypothetical protein